MPSHLIDISAAMRNSAFYPHDVADIELEETHISMVFLTGKVVYKLKKPVQFGFLDFTTLDNRRRYCSQEVMLNRRLSKGIYEGVVPITREGDHYELNGRGTVVEYAVQMRQLPSHQTLKRLLAKDVIGGQVLDQLARVLVEFYRNAATGKEIDAMGAISMVQRNCEENFEQTAEFSGTTVDSKQYTVVKQATDAFLRRRAEWFEERIREQKIRDGHGDLRAGHIYITSGGIQIIDCIEFNRRFRYVDVIGDLAFLLMDLDFLMHPESARSFYRSYLSYSNDVNSANLLSFYKCYRAMVRIKVNCLRLQQSELDKKARNAIITQTQRYMTLAHQYALSFGRPVIWVVCGLIASGKSTLAQALARALGVERFNSDRIRKALRDGTHDSGPVPYGKGLYAEKKIESTYAELLANARQRIENGDSVVLDATFGNRKYRDNLRKIARRLQARSIFVECRCSEDVLRERLKEREKRSGLDSDARMEHLEPIKVKYAPLQEIPEEDLIRLDTQLPPETNLHELLSHLA